MRLAHRLSLLQRQHLIAAGLVQRIVQRGAAAGSQLPDALVQHVDVAGKVLRDVDVCTSKPSTKARSCRPQHLQQKIRRRLLLK